MLLQLSAIMVRNDVLEFLMASITFPPPGQLEVAVIEFVFQIPLGRPPEQFHHLSDGAKGCGHVAFIAGVATQGRAVAGVSLQAEELAAAQDQADHPVEIDAGVAEMRFGQGDEAPVFGFAHGVDGFHEAIVVGDLRQDDVPQFLVSQKFQWRRTSMLFGFL